MCLSYYPVSLSSLHKFKTLLGVINYYFVESLHVDAILFVLMYMHFLLFSYMRVVLKQVGHLLVVELQERAVYFYVLTSACNQSVE